MLLQELTVDELNKVIRKSVSGENYPQSSADASHTFDKSVEALALITKSLVMTQAGLSLQTALICAATAFFRAGMEYANQERAKTAVN